MRQTLFPIYNKSDIQTNIQTDDSVQTKDYIYELKYYGINFKRIWIVFHYAFYNYKSIYLFDLFFCLMIVACWQFLTWFDSGQNVWIGLREFVANQLFYWMDRTTVYSNIKGSGLWDPHEPSFSSGEYCVQIGHDNGNKLKAKNCGRPYPFICKG